jgi:hypothetical protein
MAHFIGAVQAGEKTKETRLGTAKSGMTAGAFGWDIGGEVCAFVNSAGLDSIDFYLTGGSNGRISPKKIASAVLKPNGEIDFVLLK